MDSRPALREPCVIWSQTLSIRVALGFIIPPCVSKHLLSSSTPQTQALRAHRIIRTAGITWRLGLFRISARETPNGYLRIYVRLRGIIVFYDMVTSKSRL